jgi:membrane associated rhomboid family serine protease
MNNMPITIALIFANVIVTVLGWSQAGFLDRFKFQVGPILYQKDFKRLVTGSFLHADVNHLVLNMLTLYLFGEFLEPLCKAFFGNTGPLVYLILYFGSMLGGDLLTLYLKRNDHHYSAIGASGAIAGIVFAYVIIDPEGWLLLLFILPIPTWLYALLYVAYSIYGIQRQFDNIGHNAHLGGAMAGMVLTFVFFFQISLDNWPFLLILGTPTILLIYLLEYQTKLMESPLKAIQRWLRRSPAPPKTRSNPSPSAYSGPVKQDGLEVNRRANLQKELDALLDKVARKSYAHLSEAERKRLDQLGKELSKNTDMSGGRAPSQ